MKILSTPLPGVILLELDVFNDHRGQFMETYRRDQYLELGVGRGLEFVQDNFSSSQRNTLRGLHYQLHEPQGKLVHVTRGEVFDVAIDVRFGSPTFGQSFGVRLSASNHLQLWIPPGFAHGFLVTSEAADFVYKMTACHTPPNERRIAWDDPDLAIPWPLEDAPILSKRDLAAPKLHAAELPEYVS